MTNFFTAPKTTQILLLVVELEKQDFEQLEPAGQGNLFIDKINRNYWFCSDDAIQDNIYFIENLHKQKVEQITLDSIQSWES
jgi:hypothetical protein